MQKSIYKKKSFKHFEYNERYQKKSGKKIASGISRARLKAILTKGE